MQKSYPDDVVVISLNVDHEQEGGAPSDELRKDVLAKLSDLKLQTINVMSSDAYDDVLARHDLFSLPAAIVYDRDGKLLKVFEGDLSYEKQIFPLLAELTTSDEISPAAAEAVTPD